MLSPGDLETILIEITNACVNSCSNCSRFCGHHQKPFFMDFETFKKAVDSLEGYQGKIGIMGGEPTLHPDFAKMSRYLQGSFGGDTQVPSFTGPRPNSEFWKTYGPPFFEPGDPSTKNPMYEPPINMRRLFSVAGENFYKNFELIQDIYGLQSLNDHKTPSAHNIFMITRKELGIPDDEWVTIRDNCNVPKYCSATITPKGAFFCENAGSLDMLLDGPGGWPIEPGWWKRKPEDFGSQLDWCEMCGFCLSLTLPSRFATEEISDATPVWVEKLEKIKSRKLGTKHLNVVDPRKISPGGRPKLRINDAEVLLPQDIQYIPVAGDQLYPREITVLRLDGSIPDGFKNTSKFRVSPLSEASDWVLLLDAPNPSEKLLSLLSKNIFNPGCLFVRDGYLKFFNVKAMSLQDGYSIEDLDTRYPECKKVTLMSDEITDYYKPMDYSKINQVTGQSELIESLNSKPIVHKVPVLRRNVIRPK